MLALFLSLQLALISRPTRTTPFSRSALNQIALHAVLCRAASARVRWTRVCSTLPAAPIEIATKILVLQHPQRQRRRRSVPLLPLCLRDIDIRRGDCFSADLEPLHMRSRMATNRCCSSRAMTRCLSTRARCHRHCHHPQCAASSRGMTAPPPAETSVLQSRRSWCSSMARGRKRSIWYASPASSWLASAWLLREPLRLSSMPCARSPERHCMSTEACARFAPSRARQ